MSLCNVYWVEPKRELKTSAFRVGRLGAECHSEDPVTQNVSRAMAIQVLVPLRMLISPKA